MFEFVKECRHLALRDRMYELSVSRKKSNEMFEFVKNLSIGFMTSDGPIVYAEEKIKMFKFIKECRHWLNDILCTNCLH